MSTQTQTTELDPSNYQAPTNGHSASAPAGASAPATVPEEGDSLLGVVSGRIKKWIAGQEKAPVVVDSTPPQEQTIQQLAIDADTPINVIIDMLASNTKDTDEVISGIDEDKEPAVASVITQLIILVGYLLPPVASIFAGLMVGMEFAGDPKTAWLPEHRLNTLGVVVACLGFELAMVLLVFAIMRVLRRFANSKKGLGTLVTLFLVYLVMAGGSGLALWTIYYDGLVAAAGGDATKIVAAALVGVSIRSMGVPLIDLACSIALPLIQYISLDKKLADIKKKSQAVIAINREKIASHVELVNEAIATKSTLQKEKDYQNKNELANTLIDLIGQKIIQDARNSLQGGSFGSRRDYQR